MNYYIEGIFVGLATMILGTFLSVLAMYSSKDFKISKIDFWPSMLITNFLTGFLIHIICQWTGINKWYCKNGNACN